MGTPELSLSFPIFEKKSAFETNNNVYSTTNMTRLLKLKRDGLRELMRLASLKVSGKTFWFLLFNFNEKCLIRVCRQSRSRCLVIGYCHCLVLLNRKKIQ